MRRNLQTTDKSKSRSEESKENMKIQRSTIMNEEIFISKSDESK